MLYLRERGDVQALKSLLGDMLSAHGGVIPSFGDQLDRMFLQNIACTSASFFLLKCALRECGNMHTTTSLARCPAGSFRIKF